MKKFSYLIFCFLMMSFIKTDRIEKKANAALKKIFKTEIDKLALKVTSINKDEKWYSISDKISKKSKGYMVTTSAIGRFDKVNQKSFAWVLVGALLFMFSDTLIALNNFTTFFEGNKYLAKIFIMSFYAGGQYLIVKGFFEQKNNSAFYCRRSRK